MYTCVYIYIHVILHFIYTYIYKYRCILSFTPLLTAQRMDGLINMTSHVKDATLVDAICYSRNVVVFLTAGDMDQRINAWLENPRKTGG